MSEKADDKDPAPLQNSVAERVTSDNSDTAGGEAAGSHEGEAAEEAGDEEPA